MKGIIRKTRVINVYFLIFFVSVLLSRKMPKEKYESPNPRRCHTIMSQDEQLAGKKSSWSELEICGRCKKPNEDHIIGGRIPASRQFATHIIEILDKHV